jgi:hypothetical protein
MSGQNYLYDEGVKLELLDNQKDIVGGNSLRVLFAQALEGAGCPKAVVQNLCMEFFKASWAPEHGETPKVGLEGFADGQPFYQMRLSLWGGIMNDPELRLAMGIFLELQTRRKGTISFMSLPGERMSYAENFRAPEPVFNRGMATCMAVSNILSPKA